MKAENPSFFPQSEYKERKIDRSSIFNFSEFSVEKVISYFPTNLKAEKIVVMPDLNPGRAALPSGCSVEFNVEREPNWRRFLLSDIGCGIQVLKSNLSWADFENNLSEWDKLYIRLKKNKGTLGDLGSGNHFLDAAIDDDENVYFVVHTGSRSESSKVDQYVNRPEKFDEVYKKTQNWAKANRDHVAYDLVDFYGNLKLLFDQPHNSYEKTGNKVVIYKGTVNLQPGQESIIPSSMDTDMVIIEGKAEELAKINNTIAHGTGRHKSRGEAKEDAYFYDFEALRRRIHIPGAISINSILTENPSCYRDLDDTLAKISDLIIVTKRLHPIAYIGQI